MRCKGRNITGKHFAYVCSCFSAAARFALGRDGPQKLWRADLLTLIYFGKKWPHYPSAKYFHNRGQVRTANHQRIVGMFVSYVSNCRCPGLSLNDVWKWHKLPNSPLSCFSSALFWRSGVILWWCGTRKAKCRFSLLFKCQKRHTYIRNCVRVRENGAKL